MSRSSRGEGIEWFRRADDQTGLVSAHRYRMPDGTEVVAEPIWNPYEWGTSQPYVGWILMRGPRVWHVDLDGRIRDSVAAGVQLQAHDLVDLGEQAACDECASYPFDPGCEYGERHA